MAFNDLMFILVTITGSMIFGIITGEIEGRWHEKRRIKKYIYDRSCNIKNGKREPLSLIECNVLRKIKDEL